MASFVDDLNVKVQGQKDKLLKESIQETMDIIKDYVDSNQLSLNGDKSKVLIVSKNKQTKDNFSIMIQGKEIKHSSSVNILGTFLDENMSWEKHVEK